MLLFLRRSLRLSSLEASTPFECVSHYVNNAFSANALSGSNAYVTRTIIEISMCHLVSLLKTLNRDSKQSFVYSTLLSVTDSGYAVKRRLNAVPSGVCYLHAFRIPEVHRHCVSYVLWCFPLLSSSAGHANIPHSALLIGARVTERFQPVVSVYANCQT